MVFYYGYFTLMADRVLYQYPAGTFKTFEEAFKALVTLYFTFDEETESYHIEYLCNGDSDEWQRMRTQAIEDIIGIYDESRISGSVEELEMADRDRIDLDNYMAPLSLVVMCDDIEREIRKTKWMTELYYGIRDFHIRPIFVPK